MSNPKLFVTLRHWFPEEQEEETVNEEKTKESENNVEEE